MTEASCGACIFAKTASLKEYRGAPKDEPTYDRYMVKPKFFAPHQAKQAYRENEEKRGPWLKWLNKQWQLKNYRTCTRFPEHTEVSTSHFCGEYKEN